MRSREELSAEPPITGLGQIEYQLARDSIIREYRRGRLSRVDICDAQPELLRVAKNLGRPTEVECPICEEAELVHVLFAFGPRLPSSGRAVTTPGEMRGLTRATRDVAFYLVEVCAECGWNHLLRMFNGSAAKRRLRR
ncbi:MAG: DUF5318 family protein [Nitrososphaerales archaeon]